MPHPLTLSETRAPTGPPWDRGVDHAGIEPLPEHALVKPKEDVQDLCARAYQAAEDLGLVGVADQLG